MTHKPHNKNTVSSQYDLKAINKIRKLAKKKGTPLLEVSFSKKTINFMYSTGVGVIERKYYNRAKGIEIELRKLE